MGDAVTRTGDPKFGSVLQSYANAFMDDLNKITKMEIEAGADINYSKQVAFFNSQRTEFATTLGSAKKSFDRYYLNTDKAQEFLDYYAGLAEAGFGKYGSPAATQMDALNVEGMHKDQLRELKMIMNTFDIPEGIENNFELGKDAIDNIDDPNHRFYVLQTSSALANHFDSLSQNDSDYAKLRTLTTSLHNRLSGVYNYSTSAFGYGGNWGNGNRIQTKATKSRPTSTFRKSLLPGT